MVSIRTDAVNGDFAQTNAYGTSVAAGANCTITVAFAPTTAWARSAMVTITDNATGSPHTVALSGTGTDFSITIARIPGDRHGRRWPDGGYNLALNGTSGFTGTVALTCAGAPSLSTCATTPSSLSLSGTNTLNTTVSVSTMVRGMAVSRHLPPQLIVPLRVSVGWLALAALSSTTFAPRCRPRGLKSVRIAFVTVLLFVTMLATWALISCGGGSGTPLPPPGTYSLTVTAIAASGSATLTHKTTLTLTVN